jgi:hypothetical protein
MSLLCLTFIKYNRRHYVFSFDFQLNSLRPLNNHSAALYTQYVYMVRIKPLERSTFSYIMLSTLSYHFLSNH